MELKQAYISHAICHRYSSDPTKSLINHQEVNLDEVNAEILRKFFVNPFSNIKREYGFTHQVDLAYNVIYQISLSVLNGMNFVEASINIFKHLNSVSDKPSIKDGDIFVCKIEDIEINGSYLEGLCVFKIESKNQFIETNINTQGQLDLSTKIGFSTNKIDKAALIVFTDKQPTVIVIDKSKDTKFWKDDFLGLALKNNNFSQTENAVRLIEGFISDELNNNNPISKEKRIQILNKGIELMKAKDSVNLSDIGRQIFEDPLVVEQFEAYREAFEEHSNLTFQDSFAVDKTGLSTAKSIRRIRLDDNAEIYLLKTGTFIERGFDSTSNQYYYTLFFSREK
ncbi:nucleoid-associated protein [Bacteroides acidifaciens]|jgi:hypothetical protein|uniref:nucleoid-associated protein n=1 Tax=Bacteroides acidifaciens TaxID=85831 RepID=UPI002570DA72|nr:nucleoid-associated protein [Bacteroides acidifaciens]